MSLRMSSSTTPSWNLFRPSPQATGHGHPRTSAPSRPASRGCSQRADPRDDTPLTPPRPPRAREPEAGRLGLDRRARRDYFGGGGLRRCRALPAALRAPAPAPAPPAALVLLLRHPVHFSHRSLCTVTQARTRRRRTLAALNDAARGPGSTGDGCGACEVRRARTARLARAQVPTSCARGTAARGHGAQVSSFLTSALGAWCASAVCCVREAADLVAICGSRHAGRTGGRRMHWRGARLPGTAIGLACDPRPHGWVVGVRARGRAPGGDC